LIPYLERPLPAQASTGYNVQVAVDTAHHLIVTESGITVTLPKPMTLAVHESAVVESPGGFFTRGTTARERKIVKARH
jgi:hypothetical protein